MMLASPKPMSFAQRIEAENAPLFVSVASLTEIAVGITKMRARLAARADALRAWLDSIRSMCRSPFAPAG